LAAWDHRSLSAAPGYVADEVFWVHRSLVWWIVTAGPHEGAGYFMTALTIVIVRQSRHKEVSRRVDRQIDPEAGDSSSVHLPNPILNLPPNSPKPTSRNWFVWTSRMGTGTNQAPDAALAPGSSDSGEMVAGARGPGGRGRGWWKRGGVAVGEQWRDISDHRESACRSAGTGTGNGPM
jgi:hypothetical protein